MYGELGAFFLLMDKPETYRLVSTDQAVLPRRNNFFSWLGAGITAAFAVVAGIVAFRRRGEMPQAPATEPAVETPPATPAPDGQAKKEGPP